MATVLGLALGGCNGEQVPLPLDHPLTAPLLAGGDAPRWHVTLRQGETLHLEVEQRGVDASVAVLDPSGETVLQIDSQNVAWGPEVLWWTAPRDGLYQVVLRRLSVMDRGDVRIVAEVLKHANDRVQERVRACTHLDQARRAEEPRARSEALRTAVDAWRRAGEGEQVVLTLLALAEVFQRQGEVEEDVAACAEALREVRGWPLPGLETTVLQRYGRALRRAGDREAARQSQEESLALARSRDDPRRAGLALRHLARLALDAGDYLQAARDHRAALKALRRAGDQAQVAGALHDLSFVYTVLGRRTEAREGYREALELRRRSGDARGVAVTLTEIGWLDMEDGNPETARRNYLEALEIHREAGDLRNQAGVLDRLGSALMAEGKWVAARTAYKDSLTLSRRLESRANQANTQCNLGELEVAAGRPEVALSHANQALELYEALPVREVIGEVHVLHVRSLAEEALGHLARAEASSAAALQRVEEMRRKLASQALSLPFFAVRREYLDQYVGVLMARHRESIAGSPSAGPSAAGAWQDRALSAVERGRAQGLLERMLTRAEAEESEESRRRKVIQARINAVHREQAAVRDPESSQAARLDRELRSLTHDLAEVLARVDVDAVASRFLEADAMNQLLDEETSILSFHLGAHESFLWVIDHDGVETYGLPPAAEIETVARSYYEGVRRRQAVEANDQSRLLGQRLGQMLLGNVADLADRQRIVVVADGILHYVPFAALEEPGRGEPLAARHEVVRIPSVSVLEVLRERSSARPRPPRTVAIMADPVFGAWDFRVERGGSNAERRHPEGEAVLRSSRDLGLGSLSRLRGSRREAEAIAALLPASEVFVALDFAANRGTVTDAQLGQYRILHFATHGFLHPRHDELTGLVLSLVDAEGHSQDGFLRAHELADLDLNADLVVLSACHTALGSAIRGEGLLGLPRSLMEAGASAVLVSLWKIDDEATADFMDYFYRGLLVKGLSPGAALVQAQRAMRRESRWREPFYWAGFELQGEWRGRIFSSP